MYFRSPGLKNLLTMIIFNLPVAPVALHPSVSLSSFPGGVFFNNHRLAGRNLKNNCTLVHERFHFPPEMKESRTHATAQTPHKIARRGCKSSPVINEDSSIDSSPSSPRAGLLHFPASLRGHQFYKKYKIYLLI